MVSHGLLLFFLGLVRFFLCLRMESLTPQSHIGIIGIEPNRTEPNRTEPIWFVFGLRDHVFRIPHQILCPVHQTGAQTDSSRVFWGQIMKISENQQKIMKIDENQWKSTKMQDIKRCATPLRSKCIPDDAEISHQRSVYAKSD